MMKVLTTQTLLITGVCMHLVAMPVAFAASSQTSETAQSAHRQVRAESSKAKRAKTADQMQGRSAAEDSAVLKDSTNSDSTKASTGNRNAKTSDKASKESSDTQ